MRLNVRFLLLGAAISFVALFAWGAKGQEPAAPKVIWEYTVAKTPENPSLLKQLGEDGWELVAVRTEEKLMGNYRHTEVSYYLKRPKAMAK